MSSEDILFGMGNPLLDISAEVDIDIVKKYKCNFGNAILAQKEHMPVYDELVKNYKVNYSAGGSTQNTFRVFNWLLEKKNTSTFVGCIGDDQFGKNLEKSAKQAGVKVIYQINKEFPTGTCAALIVGKERSLIANLSAAEKYNVDHLKSKEVFKYMTSAKYYYIAGYFLTVSTESIKLVAEHAAKENKMFMMVIFLINFKKIRT
jgi:adenosine kinase